MGKSEESMPRKSKHGTDIARWGHHEEMKEDRRKGRNKSKQKWKKEIKKDASAKSWVLKQCKFAIDMSGHQNQPASPDERGAKMGEARDAAKNMSDNFILRGQEPNIDQVLKNATQNQRGVASYPFTQQEIAQLKQWIVVDINNTKQFFAQHPEELAKRKQEAGIRIPQPQQAPQAAKPVA